MSLRDGETKSVAGLTTGTAGLTRGTVKPLAQENYLPRSHEKDRDLSLDASSGLTTGTHIIYHVGCGVEATEIIQIQVRATTPNATATRGNYLGSALP